MISVLKNSKIFQGLTADELEKVCQAVMPTEKEYCKNQIIINQGEPVHKIGILKKGSAISTKYHFNGNAQILRIYHQGEALLLEAVNTTLLTSPVTLISQTDSVVVYVSYAEIVKEDAISPKIKEVIMSNCSEILSNELIRLMYKIDVLSKRNEQQVPHYRRWQHHGKNQNGFPDIFTRHLFLVQDIGEEYPEHKGKNCCYGCDFQGQQYR